MHIRLLSYNIHKGIGGVDRRYRPERLIEVIAHYQPDILLLQEVDDGARRSRGDRQSDLIGRALGLAHRAFFPNVPVRGGGVYGNAVISRFPIAAARNISLTFPGRKSRSVLHAALHVAAPHGGRPRSIHVFNMHLGLAGHERRWQLERFLQSHPFSGLPQDAPVIVGGDLNDLWGRLGRTFLEPAGFSGQVRAANTFPALAPVRALDAVYFRGEIKVRHIRRSHLTAARFASDHLPLIADIEVGGR